MTLLKNYTRRAVLIATAALVLGGCGDSNTATPPKDVSLEPFKAVYGGTAPVGTQYRFDLSGTDTTGKAYTGSYTLTSKGEILLEGRKVYHSQEQFQLLVNGQIVNTETRQTFWSDPNSIVYRQWIDNWHSGNMIDGPEQMIFEDELSPGMCDHGRVNNNPIKITGKLVPGGTVEERYRYDVDCTEKSPLDYQFPAIGNVTLSSRYTANMETWDKSVGFYLAPDGTPYKMTLKTTLWRLTIPRSTTVVTLHSN
ncbi:MAG: hypothetical protein FIA89_07110 [Geobacter sp.]|nr:hypothetical protein [Geobacter sp.]